MGDHRLADRPPTLGEMALGLPLALLASVLLILFSILVG